MKNYVAKLNPQRNLSGDKEWGKFQMNFMVGCPNDCNYCFPKAWSCRVGRKTADTWKIEIPRLNVSDCKFKKMDGVIMFPESHDISISNMDNAFELLRKMLVVGNSVFFITKAHFKVIEKLCNEFTEYKDNLLVCITIGSTNSQTLKFWEPGASNFEERFEALKLAYNSGYKTMVSAEPMLDKNIDELIETLSPYVTNDIWIGKINNLRSTLSINGCKDLETQQKADELEQWQNNPNFILPLYEKYKDNPKIQWKETYSKEILGVDYKKRKC